ncbi:MAG: hypothetical protein A3C08_00960 [Candidatus Taylorbacteria bacterium RIFCSPHIGHO2_02_FULL_47_18]|nr:MAG: hypothetical protein A3C08_00960 [Candidatus Taylorbacteria bacterium RIFCSPHIGHO2_02_FULL_47_18]OHA40365.1 MAG: hypothetical protein A3J31_02055 [Candidatus Taylorbacteria bacterium RIFCSPLOWO2_02_FULL_48_16]
MKNNRKNIKDAFSIAIAVIRKPKMFLLLLLGCLLFLSFEGTLWTLPAFAAILFVLVFWISYEEVCKSNEKKCYK